MLGSAQRRSRAATATVVRALLLLCLVCLGLAVRPEAAFALKAIEISDAERVEITALGEAYDGRGDTLQIETAPGGDGIRGRMSVRAATPGTNPSWFVFALTNTTDKGIERWLAADRYGAIGSGIVWPDLDARRIEVITPSVGFVPERVKNDRADVFRLTLEPGQTVTFVAELASERFARLFLWKAREFEQKSRDRQLFNGIMLGITGLLAIFLTAVFAANHKAIFPMAAIFTWCVLAYLCVDFGFWQKLFNIRPEENAAYRAATEAAMAATLLIFLSTFLRLGAWHGFVRMLLWLWIVAQLALIAVAFLDPRLAATFARLSSIAIAGAGAVLTLFLAMRGQDRALSLVPTLMLLLVWLFGTGVAYTGRLSGDIVQFGLTAGLVLIVVLIGFTVTQYAFRTIEPLYGAQPGEQQLRSLAVDGAGAAVWEWNARRDEVKVSAIVDAMLGLKPGELSTNFEEFGKHMHPADRERFKLLLASVKGRAQGELRVGFRMRHVDNSYRWFELEAATVPSMERRNVRCVGLIREVTDAKRAQERLLHDAVHDTLTGLPNRELFLDRLATAAKRATLEPLVRPALLFIDIDKFKTVNTAFGLIVGDSLLLTIARRLGRNLGPQDTLGRIGGDQFALLLLSQSHPRELAMLAEQVRRSLRAPVNIAGQEIVLTASIGIALYDGPDEDPAELLREAEIAMYRAKRAGPDRIEIFSAEMRADKAGRVELENDLRRAIEKKQLNLAYQPIFYLPTESLAGFEAQLRWEHASLGLVNPSEYMPIAEDSDLIIMLGAYALGRAAREAARWQKEMPRPDAPLFVSVNVASRQLFRPELVTEVRRTLGRAVIPKGSLRLEITEALVMENPEKATAVLRQLADAGAGVSLDDFGTGFSSLSYLDQFTFDSIKVDRSFLQAGEENGSGSIILRSVVALSHELGKSVVAEGVETEQDVSFLRSIGCEYGQGAYYGEPMSERDALQLVKVARRAERRLKKSGVLRTRRKSERVVDQPAAQGVPAAVPAAQPSPRLPAPVAARQRVADARRPAPAVAAAPPAQGRQPPRVPDKAPAAPPPAPPPQPRGPPPLAPPPLASPAAQGAPGQGAPGRGAPGQGAAGQGAAGQGAAGQGAAGQGAAGQGTPGQGTPGQGAPGQGAPGRGAPGQAAAAGTPPTAPPPPPGRLLDGLPPTPLRPVAGPIAARKETEAASAAGNPPRPPPPPAAGPPPLPARASSPPAQSRPPPLPEPRAQRPNGAPPQRAAAPRPAPDFSNLPPAIAASLARLAGKPLAEPAREEGPPGVGGKAPGKAQ
jgi:diguanylate cyclase (GGDEF)-like protein